MTQELVCESQYRRNSVIYIEERLMIMECRYLVMDRRKTIGKIGGYDQQNIGNYHETIANYT